MTPDIIETVQDEYLLEESLLLGLNAYLHIKWSAVFPIQDSDLKDTPDAYIGVCTNNEATAPTRYTAYTWYLWKGAKGDTGLTGSTGATGAAAYVHIKWSAVQPTQNSDLSDTMNSWIGICSDHNELAPTAYNAYQWYQYKGATGRGITKIEKTAGTGAAGTTDTYTIRYSDNTTSTFSVYNGVNGAPFVYSDFTAEQLAALVGATGAAGRGITKIEKTAGTGAAGTTDTYTITYSDSTTSTFSVYNGANGAPFVYSDFTSEQLAALVGATGAAGRGISDVTRTAGSGAAGTTDTYTITYSDNTTSAFSVYNGADGLGSGDMLKSAYDTNNDGVVNDSDKLGGVAASGYAREINGQTAFTDIADADYVPMYDTSASSQKKSLWSNIKSVLKTYFDTLYQATITGGATTIASSNLTVSRALTSNASGKVAVSAVTATELGYVSGVTSAIQTQLGGKQATITGGATTIASNNLTASRALTSDSSGKVVISAVTATELGYVSGVTSAIQTQLNAKMPDNANQSDFTDIADGDYVPMYDVSASTQKKTLWSNVKSVLKTYFDTIYTGLQASGSNTTNSTTGRIITHTFGSIAATAYRVVITPTLTAAPTTSTAGSLGEVYVVKNANGTFTVYNTGAVNLAFDWLAMKA